MVMLAVAATIHWLVAAAQALPTDPLSQQVLARVANPLLTSAQFLIPAAVAISGIHKMMEHRESGGSFMVDMVTKGGIAGAALDLIGRCAAIVDANLANPDAWGQLNLPAGAATVRDMVAALAANQEPPRPVHASTPALACYPESREASEYSRTEIGLFAGHLRARYPLVVIDLSNRLPDPTGGPEASAAAYWLEHADVLVLPSAASKQDFNGVLDYLEVRDIPPVIVAALVPRTRRNREHPLAKRYMSAIAQRAYRVVDIPDDAERVRYAGMQGVPVESVSTALKAAYRQLAEAVASAPLPVAP
jgi:hypothetical protein